MRIKADFFYASNLKFCAEIVAFDKAARTLDKDRNSRAIGTSHEGDADHSALSGTHAYLVLTVSYTDVNAVTSGRTPTYWLNLANRAAAIAFPGGAHRVAEGIWLLPMDTGNGYRRLLDGLKSFAAIFRIAVLGSAEASGAEPQIANQHTSPRQLREIPTTHNSASSLGAVRW